MQVFGYLRFSFYGRSDAQLSHNEDHETYLNELYHADRMADRFHFFEHLCLPSIRQQTDKDFTLIVLASEVMPDHYKQRLSALVEGIPQIVLVFSDETDMAEVFNGAAQDLGIDPDERSIHFRLDDDDGLGSAVVRDLRKMATNVNQHTLLTMPNGLALVVDPNGVQIYPEYQPFLAIGFAFVNMPGQIRNPFQCAHFQVSKRMPSMMEPRPWAFLHLLHTRSDSASTRGGKLRKLPAASKITREQMDKGIARHFPSFTWESMNTICSTSPGMLALRDIEPEPEPEKTLKVVSSR